MNQIKPVMNTNMNQQQQQQQQQRSNPPVSNINNVPKANPKQSMIAMAAPPPAPLMDNQKQSIEKLVPTELMLQDSNSNPMMMMLTMFQTMMNQQNQQTNRMIQMVSGMMQSINKGSDSQSMTSNSFTPTKFESTKSKKRKMDDRELKDYEETERIRSNKVPKTEIEERKGPGGQYLPYVESSYVINKLNQLFGYDGWADKVLKEEIIEEKIDSNGTWVCEAIVKMVMWLENGACHEDTGGGQGMSKSKREARENAIKGAISDARKRLGRLYGDALGNCLYEKEYLDEVKKHLNEERVNKKK